MKPGKPYPESAARANKLVGYLLATLLFAVAGCAPHRIAEPASPSPECALSPLRQVAAHRGAHERAPENSRQSIRDALHGGVGFIESDLRRGADGVIFLFHDRRVHLDRVVAPPELGGREIDRLEASERDAIRLKNGESLPTLPELLTIVRGTTANLLLDFKGPTEPFVEEVVAAIRAHQVVPNTIIQCSHPIMARLLRERHPDIRILIRTFSPEQVEAALTLSPQFIQVDREWISSELACKAQRHGSKIVAKSLDSEGDTEETWRVLDERRVDVVLTDFPIRLTRFFSTLPPRDDSCCARK